VASFARSTRGSNVVLMGWVNRRRDHGGLIFLDLRDRSGIAQVVVDEEHSARRTTRPTAARPEYVVAVKGNVRRRGAGLENPNMPTGEIEVVADELLLLNESKTPPFSPAEDAIANEEVRLKWRYLDLRRVEMQRNFALRSRVAMAIRNYLVGEGFLEIETPFMTKSTPEGARDYLVPSRVHAGRVLRAAAVAADLQADPDDLRLRPVLPDRALLPRRGPARRPPAGVHPDRPGDELPHAGAVFASSKAS
jgi:aspartyl-tRNA synthetase